MSETRSYLTLTEVSECVHLSTDTVILIVDHGIIEPPGETPTEWRFDPAMLHTLRRAYRLQKDLELEWAAVALALSLTEEMQALRAQNRRLRQQLALLMELDSPG